ncbi:MAG: patatin-like phospholipase family protein [Alphaproteobacteria bacterium]|nr:patatin-like phospholipase family protein [Alphaproteobacteria bacterium]
MTSSNTKIVLFNYGGGMRGLIPAHIMCRIEEETGLNMSDMVDIFAGPSTGAILNAALNVPSEADPAKPKYKARHMVRFYEREGERIFPADRFRDFRGFVHDFNNRTMRIGQLQKLLRHGHYSPSHLAKCLTDLYGDTVLSQSIRSLVVPLYNIDGGQLKAAQEPGEDQNTPVHTQNNFIDGGGHAVWLKHMQLPKNQKPTPHVKMRDAILASCAAPTYFPCHHFTATDPVRGHTREYSGIDGSIFDNPCVSYHGAIQQHLQPNTKTIMIMLGTGHTLRSFKKDDWNRFGGLGVVDPSNDLPLINILFHATESALIESFSQTLGKNLYNFNKSMVTGIGAENTPNTSIDDASPENFVRLKTFAEEIIEENRHRFETVCNLLVKNYENREKPKNRSLWQRIRFFKK